MEGAANEQVEDVIVHSGAVKFQTLSDNLPQSKKGIVIHFPILPFRLLQL